MKLKTVLLSATSIVLVNASVQAQGLLSLGQRDEFEKKLPFSVTVALGTGWDSNVNLSSSDEQASMFVKGTLSGEYSTGDRRTSYAFGITYTPFYYFEAPEGVDDFQQSAGLNFSVRHRVNQRLTITDSAYVAYEYEPNYQIGASVARRTAPYIYGYNNLNVAYAWTKRFSTVSGYTISGIDYDSESEGGENHISHMFSQDFRYAFNKVTTGVLTYRYGMTEYDNNFGDNSSQYFLAGIDHSFSRRTSGSIRAGVELQDRDNGGNSSSPYVETSFSHSVAKQTYIRWYGRYGFESADIGDSTERTSLRTGLSVQQRFNNRVAGNVGANYIHDTFEGGNSEFDDDIIEVSLGLDFNVYRNLVLNTGYSFTTTTSGQAAREYNRHLLSLGMTAKF
jgi:hypothetical protein